MRGRHYSNRPAPIRPEVGITFTVSLLLMVCWLLVTLR